MKWFKSGCVDFTKPDKQVIVEPTNERAVFEAPSKGIEMPSLGKWSDIPLYSNCIMTGGARLTIG
jgi:hypothetical protein